jgi:hypothetical protein
MRKVIVVIAVLVLGVVTATQAKKSPAVQAELLPADFKQEITNHIDYPQFADENRIQGDVWMKVTLDENSQVRIVDLSATNQELGKYVRKELKDVKIENTSFKTGEVYFMKIKFELLK